MERAAGDESQYGDDQTEGGRRPPAGAAGQPRELTPETQARAEAIDLRCLALCIGMLERVNSVSRAQCWKLTLSLLEKGCPGDASVIEL